MKYKFRLIFYSLLIIFFSNISSANFTNDVIEWTVPPEGGYGKFKWRQNGQVYLIEGEYSHNKVYWWDANYEFEKIFFKGEIKGIFETKTWLPMKGYATFPEFEGLKFFIDNKDNLDCTDWRKCQFFTKISNNTDSIDVNTKGLTNASEKFFSKLSQLQKERDNRVQEKEPEKNLLDSDQLVVASTGSGFYINDNGVVVTNYHVIHGCEKITTEFYDLSLIAFDVYNDIALLQSPRKNTPFLKIRSEGILQGEDIYVIGYPFGKDLSTSAKITKGIVTALHGMSNDYTKIQIDAPIQSGNSGGPVLDANGLLLGIAVAKADAEYFIENYGVIPDDMNFAIKVDILSTILDAHNISQKNIELMKISNGSEVFKIANPSTLYLTCFMKKEDIDKRANQ